MRYKNRIRLLITLSLLLSIALSILFFLELRTLELRAAETGPLEAALQRIFTEYQRNDLTAGEKLETIIEETVDMNRRVVVQDVLKEDRSLSFLLMMGLYLLIQAAILFFLSFSAADRLARPLQLLVDGAQRIRDGDTRYRIPEPDDTDHRKLSRTINSMLDDLSALTEKTAWQEVASFLSHQYKNPLSAIGTSAASICDLTTLSQAPDREILRETSELILSETQTLNRLIHRLKEISSFPPPKPKPVNIVHLIDELKPRWPETTWHIDWEEKNRLNLDPQYLREMMKNLFNNSFEARRSDDPPLEIHLKGSIDDREIRLIFSDSHRNLPADTARRLSSSRFTTKKNGSGLGVSLIRKMAGLQQGRLEIEYSPVGGLIFILIFPRECLC